MIDDRRILITGAAGYIGTFLRKAWQDRYNLVATDMKEIHESNEAEIFVGDIRNVEFMRDICTGIHTVVHLAANPSPSGEFDKDVLPMNIVGTHNVYRASAEAGVKRVIFASSIHAVGAYPPDVQVKWDMPVRPCCEYGASKCYGEALGHYFSDRKDMSVIAIRIGGVHGHETEEPHADCSRLDILVSEDDLTQLITRCVEVPETLRFAIVHGISDNTYKRLDVSHTRELLGYEPTDDVGAKPDRCAGEKPQPVHPG